LPDTDDPERSFTRANGGALREVLRRWQGHPALDDAFAEYVASAREIAAMGEDTDPWCEPSMTPASPRLTGGR